MRAVAMAMLISFSLSGCGSDSGSLSCPAPGETSCDSLDAVYQQTAGTGTDDAGDAERRVRVMEGHVTPKLSKAQVVRVWIAPWEDKQGDLHDHQYLYLIVRPPQWDVDRLRGINSEP